MTKAFAGWSRNLELRKASTSGGIFSEIAETYILHNDIVVAAVYGYNLSVEHRIGQNLDDIKPMRGVKYVSGKIDKGIYDSIRTFLSTGRKVVFFGLPCQCAAMRKAVGASDDLMLIDLVCFGAPSLKAWLKYVKWKEMSAGKKLASINPRDKIFGWGRKTYYRYEWEDGTTDIKLSLFDPYAQLFYSTLGFRKCCFSCKFRGVERETDMTICDCWGIETMGLKLDKGTIHNGVSGILVHSDKGLSLLNKLNVEKFECPLDELVKNNKPMLHSPEMPVGWQEFNRDIETLQFSELVDKWHLKVSRAAYLRSMAKRSIAGLLRKLGI